MQVETELTGRMQISAISSSGSVTFTPCQQGSSSWPEELVSFPSLTQHHIAATGVSFSITDIVQDYVQCLWRSAFPKDEADVAIVGSVLCKDVTGTCRREALR